MAKGTLSIYISDTVIRLMLTDGKHVTDWAEVQMEPNPVEDDSAREEEKIVQKIKQILDIKKMSTRKALVGIGGIRCLTRPIVLPKLPGEIIDEAVRREAERTLPVPLNELYMSWQTIPAPEGKTQVFLTAIPKRIVTPLMNILDKAGIKPVFMDLKPLLLARVSREENAILVDVQDSDFDVVVMVKGIPQPVRTVPFPGESISKEEKISVIREEVNRPITFYNSNNPDSPIDDNLPVHVSGILGDEAEFCSMLSQEIGREVLVLPSPVDSPPGFNPSLYMANIGLFLQDAASGKNIGPSVVNLNTLPAEYLPQPVSSLNILKMLGAAFAVILLIGMFVYLQGLLSDISVKKTALDNSQALLRQKQTEIGVLNKDIEGLTAQLASINATNSDFSQAISILETTAISLNKDIMVTFDRLPHSVDLLSVVHDTTEIIITGIADSETSVLTYYSNLDASGRFSEIEIQNMSSREDDKMDFVLRGSTMIDGRWVSGVGVVLSNLPKTITLVFADTADNALTLTGNSRDEDTLLAYLRKLDRSGVFRQININEIVRVVEDESYNFVVQLVIGE
ncbi:MAG: PilN domain-containing protein [Dehalococcoidales bacterium]|nr:PilN domain-containing protein [Dehalococcoidales bacterium]